jgi:hypothetical protein
MTSRDRLGDCEPSPFPSISGDPNRIRRFDAAFVSNTLCRPPVRVAAETVEAASASPDLENSERGSGRGQVGTPQD